MSQLDGAMDIKAWEPAVLIQSRSHTSQAYGVSSHKDVVNQAFRPPLLTQIDTLPLSRQPRDTVVPRNNPGMDGRETGFLAQNTTPTNIGKHITDKVGYGNIRPTFCATQYQTPIDNIDLPALAEKRPIPHAYTNTNGRYQSSQLDNGVPDIALYDKTTTYAFSNPGISVDYIDYSAVPSIQLHDKIVARTYTYTNPSYRPGVTPIDRPVKGKVRGADAHTGLMMLDTASARPQPSPLVTMV